MKVLIKNTLWFLRLRINDDNSELIYEELRLCFHTELHVYGQIVGHEEKGGRSSAYGFPEKKMSHEDCSSRY